MFFQNRVIKHHITDYSYDNYQAHRLEMVRHTQLATVTVTDGAKHCVAGRQWSQAVRVHFRFMFI